MNFNQHFALRDKHAFLGASKYHWVNYSPDQLDRAYMNWRAAEIGTEFHKFAADAIRLGVKLARSKKTLNAYVNDAVGFRMTPEVILYYSDNCFGTADTIAFEKDFLRIHDLKTGVTKANMHQLEIYMALFCLEYGKDPNKIGAELRIYQNDGIQVSTPNPEWILEIMNKITDFDQRIEKLKMGGR